MKRRGLNELLVCVIIATIVCKCQGSDQSPSNKKRKIEKQLKIRDALQRSRGKKLLELVKRHDFLRAYHMIGEPVISTCIRNNSEWPDNPYPQRDVQNLLNAGVDIDQRGTDGRTALMETAVGMSLFSEHVLKGLLDHKADPTKLDDEGYNALGIAIMSNRSDKNILILAGLPSIVHEPLFVYSQWTTPLNALITTDNPSCIYRKKIIKKVLDAGAQIRMQDICDSLEPGRAHDVILKRCSLAQLQQALPLVEQHALRNKFSKKDTLLQAIQEKMVAQEQKKIGLSLDN